MQRGRERKDSIYSGGPFDRFGSFEGFGHPRSMIASIFGGRDPFDDPFFTRPFGSMSGSSMFNLGTDRMFGSSMFNTGIPFRDSPQISRAKEPIIEELHTDDEDEENLNDTGAKEEKNKAAMYTESNNHPHVEHPDEEANDYPADKQSKDVACGTDYNKVEGTKPQARSVSFQKVTYGGINGTYYTATTSRRTGNDGVVLEECKQADRTTGQATHRISRGIHDKGHSVTRKLNSDGKVDTMQTLHNLNEDEFGGFEQAWKGNAERHFPGWDGGVTFDGTAGASGSGWGGGNLALPFEGFSRRAGRMGGYNEARTSSSGGRPKKVVTINIE